jgi:hypothetical protein
MTENGGGNDDDEIMIVENPKIKSTQPQQIKPFQDDDLEIVEDQLKHPIHLESFYKFNDKTVIH